MDYSQHVIERFWRKVDKSQGSNACWQWTGGVTGQGYGAIGINGTTVPAHRFSLQIHSNIEGIGFYCLHSCNNSICVNPHHLRWGTAKDNAADRSITQKWANKSERQRNTQVMQLNISQRDYIVQLLRAGYGVRQCARWYCVNPMVVSRIKKRLQSAA